MRVMRRGLKARIEEEEDVVGAEALQEEEGMLLGQRTTRARKGRGRGRRRIRAVERITIEGNRERRRWHEAVCLVRMWL